METRSAAERWLIWLLQFIGGMCLLAVVALVMPRGWLEAGHRRLGWGEFPEAFIAEYLARSVSSLCVFYGGLLVVLSLDVRRYAPVIRYQAIAIMALSACGVVISFWASFPLWFVGGDALGCWAYAIPMLVMVRKVEKSL